MSLKASETKRPKPRMDREHLFKFSCNPGVPCFTNCCRDITIVLTPYDVLCLKKRLGLPSDEFLDRYTLIIPKEGRLIPMVILKMNEADKKCPFVSPGGCIVYPERPWPCRMYPLDMEGDGTFHLVTDSTHCLGLKENCNTRISHWLAEQGILPYEQMNELLSTITIPLQAHEPAIENPQIAKMVFMALYNLDRFRDFVFKSTFLDRFEVEEPERIEAIRKDDVELLKFAMDWIKFGVFGEKLFWVKEPAHEKKQQ